MEGVCVCNDVRTLVGVVTGMDLVFREKHITPPAVVAILDLVLQFGRVSAREIEKIEAATVGDLMTREVVTVERTTPVDQIATLMVDKHLSLLPILEGGRPIGVVTRRGMVAFTLKLLLKSDG